MPKISFREIDLSDAELLLNWRSKPRVTNFMNSDIRISQKNQELWIKKSYERKDYYNWIVQNKDEDVGFISIRDLDLVNKTSSWGFYIGEDSALGLGSIIPPYFYNFLFENFGIEKITAEVFYTNVDVIKLHIMHGYKFNPKLDHVIEKNGCDELIISLYLARESFENSKFSSLRASFPVDSWLEYNNILG